MQNLFRVSFLCLLTSVAHSKSSTENTFPELQHYSPSAQQWYKNAENRATKKAKQFNLNDAGKAKNIILFVGDGMGISTITAARIFAGQKAGMAGEEYELTFDTFPYTGLSRTYNTNQQTPDSAGTMTAIITGVKTKAGILSISEDATRGDCESGKNYSLVTALELAELAGMATGIVTTTRITHATPAATYAHSTNRGWEDNSKMPAEAIAQGCQDIAQQLIYFRENLQKKFPRAKNINGLEIAFGGGRRHFLPKEKQFNSADATSKIEGGRTDNRNLVAEWQGLYPQGQVIYSAKQMAEAIKSPQLFGLFNESHMRYEADRANDILGEPSLAEMTLTAIQHLQKNKHGYFLMVEAGRVDHAHHAGNAFNALNDVLALSDAVKIAANNSSEKDTLIIVTADHSHVFTMSGYPTRGNPILGKVIGNDEKGNPVAKESTDLNGKPYTTLGYMNGLGFAHYGSETDADKRYDDPALTGRQNISNLNTRAPGYHQEALIPLESETHSGEDVAIFARGPGAQLISGSHEQNYIFHVMNYAAKLEQSAKYNMRD